MRRRAPQLSEGPFPSIWEVLGIVESRTAHQSGSIKRTLVSVSKLWPIVILCRLAIIGTVIGPTVKQGDVAITGFPIALLCLLTALDLVIVGAPGVRWFKGQAAQVQLRLMMLLIACSGFCYTYMLAHWSIALPGGTSMSRALPLLLPALVTVSICGSQRLLSLIFGLATVVPMAIFLPGEVPVPLLAVVVSGLLLGVIVQARVDRAIARSRSLNSLRAEQALALLNDFEGALQGWFWETGRDGELSYISEPLAQRFGKSAEEMIGTPLTALIERGEQINGEGKRTLGFHLSARTAFTDIAVRGAIPGDDECWWSISGRPILSEYGQFLGFRGSGADLTEIRKSQAEVARLAQFDALTGLANRSQMLATLEQSMTDQRGQDKSCALFFLDLDRFKQVNDTMGHPAGDALLRQVAQRLTRAVGNDGKVGRLGGDEFQIVLPGCDDRARLVRLADSVIESVSQPYMIEGAQVVIGVSIGIAVAPSDGANPDTLIRNADLALYKAKDNGRGVYRFYSQDLHADAEDRRQLEQDLRHAISTGGLHLEYQPVVEAASERISGFEALLRWHHPQRGPISPALFIPIAEEAGMIGQLGEWVLRTACADAVLWPDTIRIAVNVSTIQFANPNFPALVANALLRSGLPPERLELEITESVFLDEGSDAGSIFARLKALGVRLALDDFGTGYSSLGYLRTAPFDKIKIDQSFVRGAGIRGSRNGAIVQSIVNLAEALNMETTAEGAETLDELDLIRSLGCSHIQGYIYGRPVRNEAVRARFERGEFYAQADGVKASREPRRTMLRTVRLLHGTRSYDARVRNISANGALIEGLTGVPVGTAFDVDFGNGENVGATCRWSSEDRMGIEFAVRIDVATLTAAAGRRTMASLDQPAVVPALPEPLRAASG